MLTTRPGRHVIVGVVRGAHVVVGRRQRGARVPVEGEAAGAEALHLHALRIEPGECTPESTVTKARRRIVLVAALELVLVLVRRHAGDGHLPFDGIERTLPRAPHRAVEGHGGGGIVGNQADQRTHGEGAAVDRRAHGAGDRCTTPRSGPRGRGCRISTVRALTLRAGDGHGHRFLAGNAGGELRAGRSERVAGGKPRSSTSEEAQQATIRVMVVSPSEETDTATPENRNQPSFRPASLR